VISGKERHCGVLIYANNSDSGEGQTEEKFVKEVLNPHLNNYGKYLIPTLLRTKIVKSGPNFKGESPPIHKLEEI